MSIYIHVQTSSYIKYEPQTAWSIILCAVSHELSEKHEGIRQEFKPLLSDLAVTDDTILRQFNELTSKVSRGKDAWDAALAPKLLKLTVVKPPPVK